MFMVTALGVKAPTSPAARRALALYADAPRADRFHVRARWWSCPFGRVEAHVPRSGSVLEVGSGHGLLSLYLALSAPGRIVHGIDIDAHKVDLAQQAAAHLAPGEASVSFATVAPDAFPEGPFDAIVIADVLYLLDDDRRRALLERCAGALRADGVLLIKETDHRNRWKGRLTVVQERLATGVLGITAGEQVSFAGTGTLEAELQGLGLATRGEAIDRGYLHPHHLIEAGRSGHGPAFGESSRVPKEMTAPIASADEALGIDVQPDDAYFDVMARVAETHWWYRARRDWLRMLLRDRLPKGEIAVDVGCGTGEAMACLDELGASLTVGTDLSTHVLRHVARRPAPPQVLESMAEHLPFADDLAGCLISLEVIEHLDDDVAALREYKRVLRPGGVLLVTVPSYQWLWGEHDDRAAHRRRYSAARFERAVLDAGFEIDRLSYYFSFLVLPAALLRLTPLKRLVTVTDEDVSMMHPAVDATFFALARLERAIGRRWRIPFGLSLWCVARNPADEPANGA